MAQTRKDRIGRPGWRECQSLSHWSKARSPIFSDGFFEGVRGVNELLNRLEPKARRGSKPRCHWLTYGNTAQVAERLTRISESRAIVSPGDRWMPQGFTVPEEAQLNQAPRLLSSELGLRLAEWWLPSGRGTATTPIFVGQASLRHAITQCMSHYHGERNHQRLGYQLLLPHADVDKRHGQIKRRQRLRGMLSY